MITELLRGIAGLAAAVFAPPTSTVVPTLYEVNAPGGQLPVREAPHPRAQVLETLSSPGDVEVTAYDESGTWARINVSEHAGWVSRKHLAPEPREPWHLVSAPIRCFGTEPYWSFVFGPGGAAVFSELGADDDIQTSITRTLSWGGRWMLLRTDMQPEAFMTIHAADCDDGMSDQAYRLAARWSHPAKGIVLEGCCTLRP